VQVDAYFAASYVEARAKFLAAARAAGASLETLQHPLRGIGGERLACDIARLGPVDARKAIVSISATHGAEGHCGSGAQVAAWREGLLASLPQDTAAIAIHAINPYGFAWSRRVTEDNVDLNRNFVDHAKPHPANPGYAELRDAICPREWNAATRAASHAAFARYAKAHGPMKLQQALSGGQYDDPLGIFFGGRAPAWSNRLLRRVFGELALHARDIAVIDYHTGLGPYGHGEIIAPYPARADGYRRAADWLGENDITSPDIGNSSSAPLVGVNVLGMDEAAREARVTMVALEFGVRPLDETLDAVRADAWLHAHGEIDSPAGQLIRRTMRETFYGDEPRWKESVVARAFDVTRRMIAGLARG
jgi:hypothetical protein